MTIPAERIEAARNTRIETVVELYGLKLRGRIERCGPCPVCGGRDRFSVNIRKQVWLCRQCQRSGDAIALIQHIDDRVNFSAAVEILTGHAITRAPAPKRKCAAGVDNYEFQQQRKAAWLWSKRQPIPGTPAERYLRKARGYRGPIPATLGYLPPANSHQRPAMIAAFGLAEEVELGVLVPPRCIQAVHLTLLTTDGADKSAAKPSKLMIGSAKGRPIVLAPPNDLLGLAVTEGIEDALSVSMATGLGVWAAGSATFLPALAPVIPDYIESLTVYGHPDPAGDRYAQELACLMADRRDLEIRMLEPEYRIVAHNEDQLLEYLKARS